MLEDAALGGSLGPGRSGNGNFVLREFSVFAQDTGVPEPATVTLAMLGVGGLVMRRRRAA